MNVSLRVGAMLTLALGVVTAENAAAVPVRLLPGLESITFYERTGGTEPATYTFSVAGPELTQRRPDPLGAGNFDIAGASTEYYDVYYSDADGGFDLDGEYLSIEGVFLQALPAGGGLNLAEIGLNFAGEAPEFGSVVASFVALGDNAFPQNVGRAIDGDLLTHTTMGNTIGTDQRLRLTLGFESSVTPPEPPESEVPEPAPVALLALGMLMLRRRSALHRQR